MTERLTRRDLLAAGALTLGGASLARSAAAGETASPGPRFRYCFNTSTIRGRKLPLDEIVEIAATAGYDGIEPWIGEIEQYQKGGGSLADLKKRINDRGLKVESAIGFANWIVDDDARRRAGLEQAKRDMDLLRQIGGTRIAAPPAGANKQESLDLRAAGQRYAALLEVGRAMGVVAQLEFWGPVPHLHTLAEALFVAAESGHADACLLPDVYHMFRGGSDFHGLKLIDGGAMHCFHVNDYPADKPREEQKDSDRVYPGDGAAPWKQIVGDLQASGFRGALSLELFNKEYWEQDPLEVARTGLRKTRETVSRHLD